MKRILDSLLVATLPFGQRPRGCAKVENAKVTLVYQHELPNVPGKSIKGVWVEYGPGAQVKSSISTSSAVAIFFSVSTVPLRSPFSICDR
jgi:hypothetical protein